MALTIFDLASTAAIAVLCWTLYGVVYRLFLSPIADIPGPKLAALTSWYECYYDVIKPGKYAWKIKELHKQYGPIIRITPWQLHIYDMDYLDTIYDRRRDKLGSKNLDLTASVAGTEEYELHRKRRQAMMPFFTQSSVLKLESKLKEKVNQLCEIFDDKMKERSKEPLNLSDIHYAFAWDVVNRYCFGMKSDMLGNLDEAAALRRRQTNLLLGVNFSRHFPWVVQMTRLLPFFIGKHLTPPGVFDLVTHGRNVRRIVDEVLQDTNNEKRTDDATRSIFYDIRDNDELPAEEKQPLRLQREGAFLTLAGTESAARSIYTIHYHLLSNPRCVNKLREALKSLPADASIRELEQIPYLNAVIAEGNRLSFGLTTRVPRTAPEETLHYKQYKIPPGTPFTTSTLCTLADETTYPDPFLFKPERWLEPDGSMIKKPQLVFGKGPRMCLGMNLAQAEMHLVIAAVTKYNLELFETDDSDIEFRHDYQVAHPRLDSKGIRVTVKGKVE